MHRTNLIVRMLGRILRDSDGRKSRGVILPLLAIILFSIITVFIVLGINARTVKYATISLRTAANDMCASVAASMIPPSNAAFTLSDSLNNLIDPASGAIPPRTQLTRARIILPTMPGNGDFAQPRGFGGAPTFQDWNDYLPMIRGNVGAESGVDICSLISCSAGDFCTTPGGSPTRCLFQGDVYSALGNESLPNGDGSPGPIVPLSSKYPETLWNNLASAGNVVACELEAKVSTFFTTDAEYISARVVQWIPAAGKYYFDGASPVPIFDKGSAPAPDNPFVPGLSIAIATEMTTSASLQRFQFPGGFPAYYQSPVNTFTGPSVGQEFTDSPIDYVTVIPAPPDPVEARAACINPAILVRNTFVSSIVEYASRHGHFRNSTEILHVNPQHRNVWTGSPPVPNVAAVQTYPNYPAKIVRLGDDLAQRKFEIPYIFYFGGIVADPPGAAWQPDFEAQARIPTEFGAPIGSGDLFQDGFINPFVSSGSAPFGGAANGGSNWNTEIQQHHSRLASQLRSCYHLYSEMNRHHLDKIPYAAGLEPNIYDRGDPLRPGGSYTPGQPLDQNCPWASPPGAGGCGAAFGNSRSLTAAEVVAALGSTQQCPYPVDTGIGGLCAKPPPIGATGPGPNLSVSTFDLRPDLIGTMRYLAGKPIAVPEWTLPNFPTFLSQAIPAIRAPGLWRIGVQDPPSDPPGGLGLADVSAYSIFAPVGGTSAYQTLKTITQGGGTEPMPTSILVILHQRISNALFPGATGPTSEKIIMQRLVDAIDTNKPPRPITVAYFPTTVLDAQEDAVNATANAFRALLGAPEASSKNLFMVFSPFLRRYDSQALTPPGEIFDPGAGFDFRSACGLGSVPLSSMTEAQADCAFQKYWIFLLTSSDLADGIENVAKRVFFKRLTRPGLKF